MGFYSHIYSYKKVFLYVLYNSFQINCHLRQLPRIIMFLLKFKIQINVLKENLMCLYVYFCIKMVIDKNGSVDNNILIKYFIFIIFNREGK